MGKPSSSSSSSKQAQVSRVGVSMEHVKVKQEPRLSGAYIRSLVKHLTTSIKTKDSLNEEYPKLPESPLPPPPYKKQVRRRQHTTKPYQERLLNMAEARREIVTALKFHRASMKQKQTTGPPEQSVSAYPSSTTTAATAAVVPYYWPLPTTIPPPLPPHNINFTLPHQTLGLNLNLQDFTNLYHNPPSNYYSTPLSSSSSSPSTSSTTAIEETAAVEEVATTEEVAGVTAFSTTTSPSVDSGLHRAMDDEGMEEIRSLGEQHQMEWNDTVNMLMYARWFAFLKTNETEQEGENEVNPIDEFQPCKDIGEIEGIEGEWLA